LNGKERLLALSLKRLLNCFKDGALWRGDEIRRLERPFEVQWVGTILCALNWQ